MNNELVVESYEKMDLSNIDAKSIKELEEQAVKKRQLIRDAIELREMTRDLGLCYEDFKSTLNWKGEANEL